jgi:hypothetical protein
MYEYLPMELIEYIIKHHIYLPENVEKIKFQKTLKSRMLRQLTIISNMLYIDDHCCVYIHNNDIVIHNNTNNYYLYGNNQANHIVHLGNNNILAGLLDNYNIHIDVNYMTSNIFVEPDFSLDFLTSNTYNMNVIGNSIPTTSTELLSQISTTLDNIQSSLDHYFQQNNIAVSNIINPSNSADNIILQTSSMNIDPHEVVFYILNSL